MEENKMLYVRAMLKETEEVTVVQGFRLPPRHDLTNNEMEWIDMIRVITGDTDPPVTLRAVQALRQGLTGK